MPEAPSSRLQTCLNIIFRHQDMITTLLNFIVPLIYLSPKILQILFNFRRLQLFYPLMFALCLSENKCFLGIFNLF